MRYGAVAALLAAAMLSACTEPGSGVISITIATSGVDMHLNQLAIEVDGQPQRAVALNETITLQVSPGSRTVRLVGLAANCQVSAPGATRTVTVRGGEHATVEFTVTCSARMGAARISLVSSGFDMPENGYVLAVGEGLPRPVGVNDVVTFENLAEGAHEFALGGVPANCALLGANPVVLQIAHGQTSTTTFAVVCSQIPGHIRVVVSTAGEEMDADGYVVSVGTRSKRTALNESILFEDVQPGSQTVAISDVAPNCELDGPATRAVTVIREQTTEVAFTVACARPGSVRVTAATTGEDPNPFGYRVTATRGELRFSEQLPANGTATIAGMAPGDYDIALDLPVNCELSAGGPVTVRVISGETVDVAVHVICGPAFIALMTTMRPPDLYLMRSDGEQTPFRIAETFGQPSWSPDGRRLAVRSYGTGNEDIYVIAASAGSTPTRLTTVSARDNTPAWSPDGSRIAFVSERAGAGRIYVMNADGSNQLPVSGSVAGIHSDPAWSPDGSRLAFVVGSASALYVMMADGTSPNPLGVNGNRPVWSPDGGRIAFYRCASSECYIYVMNADGTQVSQLTSSPGHDRYPTWSPNGQWIAFVRSGCQLRCEDGLIAVRADGSETRSIWHATGIEWPAWQR